jgi:ParB family chromosome partitioning protein
VRPEVDDRDMLELALVENVQRRDLNPIERARAFRELMSTLETTQQEVADKVGLKRPSVANLMRLLELPEPIQAMLASEQLGLGHGRALLGLADQAAMVSLAQAAVKDGLSVREVERLVREANAAVAVEEEKPKPEVVEPDLVPWAKAMEDRMRESLGTRVQLKNGPKYKGQIVIHYYGREDLERVYDVISPREEI